MQPRASTRSFSRRSFLLTSIAAAGGAAAWARGAEAEQGILIGVCRPWSDQAALKGYGFDFSEDSVGKLLVPDQPDDVFARTREAFKASGPRLPIRSCNGFYPGSFKLVGPDADLEMAVAWADTAARRAAQLGLTCLVLGSGGPRKIPDGFARAKAEEQFIALGKRLGERAQAHGIVIAVESLNSSETNFLNKLAEVIALVDAVGSPGFQAVADFYHMAREDEGPDLVRQAGARIRHCHIAEKDKRTAPGTAGDDFRPYFKALKDIGYTGGISCECGWKDFQAQAAGAVQLLRRQWAEA